MTSKNDSLLKIDGAFVAPTTKSSTRTYWSGEPRLRSRLFRAPTEVELHLGSAPLKGYAKKIKAAGGRYSACRGYNNKRFVHIPLVSNRYPKTRESGLTVGELVDDLIAKFGCECVILRGGYRDYVLKVKTIADALAQAQKRDRAEVEAGRAKLVSEDDLTADDERYEREERGYKCHQVAAKVAELIKLTDEVGLNLVESELLALESIKTGAEHIER